MKDIEAILREGGSDRTIHYSEWQPRLEKIDLEWLRPSP